MNSQRDGTEGGPLGGDEIVKGGALVNGIHALVSRDMRENTFLSAM